MPHANAGHLDLAAALRPSDNQPIRARVRFNKTLAGNNG